MGICLLITQATCEPMQGELAIPMSAMHVHAMLTSYKIQGAIMNGRCLHPLPGNHSIDDTRCRSALPHCLADTHVHVYGLPTCTIWDVQQAKTRLVLRLLMGLLPGLGDHLPCNHEQALRQAPDQQRDSAAPAQSEAQSPLISTNLMRSMPCK